MERLGRGPDDTVAPGGPTASPDDGLPRQIGEYEILREIGRGGMGVVYLAEQPSLGRRVALKVLPHYRSGDARNVERFEREARAAARLQHPRIVPVFATGTDRGIPYFVMQYVPGQGLDEVLEQVRRVRGGRGLHDVPADVVARERGEASSDATAVAVTVTLHSAETFGVETSMHRSPVAESRRRSDSTPRGGVDYYRNVARLVAGLADALDYAHSEGVLHRDVKPSNILLEPSGHPWITDFGLAKDASTDDLTRSGEVLGTLRYLAPERLGGWSDPRSDVYSLGLTLYELATLEPAFRADNRASLVRAIEEEAPAAPRQLDGRIPRDLETIVLKAIDKDPIRRYPTMRAFGDDLRRFVEDVPILARRASLGDRVGKWAKRHRAVVSLLALLLAVILGAAVVTTILVLREAQRTRVALDEKDRALRRSEGLRLSGRSSAVLAGDPGLALLLAIEGARRYPGRQTNEALYDAMQAFDEVRVFPAGSRVEHARVSPHGKQLVTGGDQIQLWDLESGERIWRSSQGDNTRVAFDQRGEVLVGVSSPYPGIYSWDGRTGDYLTTDWPLYLDGLRSDPRRGFLGFVHCQEASLSPDSRRVAFVTRGGVRLYDRESVSEVARVGTMAGKIAWRDDGRFLFLEEDSTLLVVDAETGTVEDYCELQRQGTSTAFAVHPRSGDFAVATESDIRVFRADGMTAATLRQRFARTLAFDSQGKRIVSGAGNRTCVWDLQGSALLHELRGHAGAVLYATFISGDERILTTSEDGTARIWEPGHWERRFASGEPLSECSWAPDGRRILSQEGVWTPGTGLAVNHLVNPDDALSGRIAYDRRARFAALAGEILSVWSIDDRAQLLWRRRPPSTRRDEILVGFDWAAFSRAGDRLVTLASGEFEHEGVPVGDLIQVWETATGEERLRISNERGEFEGTRTPFFTPSGERLVVDWPVTVWDARTGRKTAEVRGSCLIDGFYPTVLSPDGARLVTLIESDATADSILISDPETGAERLEIPVAEETERVVFGPNGRFLSVVSRVDGDGFWKVHVLDFERGKRLWSTKGGQSHIVGLQFEDQARFLVITRRDGKAAVKGVLGPVPEEGTLALGGEEDCVDSDLSGKLLAAAFSDGTVRVWNLETRTCTAIFRGQVASAGRVAFSPSGDRLLTVSGTTARVWPLNPLATAESLRTRELTESEMREEEIEPFSVSEMSRTDSIEK